MASIYPIKPAAVSDQQSPTEEKTSVVFATGCPDSGWDRILPALRQAGLEDQSHQLSGLYDEISEETGAIFPSQIHQSDVDMAGIAVSLFSSQSESTFLLADSRTLWLLDSLAGQFPDARFLLFYTAPDIALAHALQQGLEDSNQFLADWQYSNRRLIDFQRKHRNRAVLLNAENASQQPRALVDVCRLISLNLDEPHPAAKTVLPAMEHLLAIHLVNFSSSVQALQCELEARAHPLNVQELTEEQKTAVILDEYLQQKAAEQEIQDQYYLIKDLLDEAKISQKKLAAINDQLANQLDAAKEERSKLIEEQKETLSLLWTLQKELRAAEATQKEQAAIIQQQTDQLAKKEAEQNKLSSLSEAEKENELLLLQLHQVQEELEDYFLKYQELTKTQNSPQPEVKENTAEIVVPGIIADTETSLLKMLMLVAWAPYVQAYKDFKIANQIRLIRKSGLFDEAWYLSEYPDVARGKIDPVKHYLFHGAKEGRDPSSQFQTSFYLRSNPDVAAKKMNPLIHYIKYGKSKGKKTSGT